MVQWISLQRLLCFAFFRLAILKGADGSDMMLWAFARLKDVAVDGAGSGSATIVPQIHCQTATSSRLMYVQPVLDIVPAIVGRIPQ